MNFSNVRFILDGNMLKLNAQLFYSVYIILISGFLYQNNNFDPVPILGELTQV